MDVKLK